MKRCAEPHPGGYIGIVMFNGVPRYMTEKTKTLQEAGDLAEAMCENFRQLTPDKITSNVFQAEFAEKFFRTKK